MSVYYLIENGYIRAYGFDDLLLGSILLLGINITTRVMFEDLMNAVDYNTMPVKRP
jgi:hypothetical protein